MGRGAWGPRPYDGGSGRRGDAQKLDRQPFHQPGDAKGAQRLRPQAILPELALDLVHEAQQRFAHLPPCLRPHRGFHITAQLLWVGLPTHQQLLDHSVQELAVFEDSGVGPAGLGFQLAQAGQGDLGRLLDDGGQALLAAGLLLAQLGGGAVQGGRGRVFQQFVALVESFDQSEIEQFGESERG